jgi:DNA polymerase
LTALHGDFESRSAVELSGKKSVGLDNYARHPTTRPWMFGWTFDDEDPVLWLPGASLSARVKDHVHKGGLFYAHNAPFEFNLWNLCCAPLYDWPLLNLDQMRCTMAMAYSMALPGALDNAAAAVGIPYRKDKEGHRLMLQMARPREARLCLDCNGRGGPCFACRGLGTVYTWWDEPDKIERLGRYCLADVWPERELSKRLCPLSEAEQEMWVIDQEINNRGILIDRPAITAAIDIVTAETARLNDEMHAATGGYVSACTENTRIAAWVQQQGVPIEGVNKAAILDALADADTPPHVRRVLTIRQEAGKTSTAKLKTMLLAASSHDDRVRHCFQYHGAATGRWAGRRIQPQNFPRPKLHHSHVDRALEVMLSSPSPEIAARRLSAVYGSPLDVISYCIRGLIIAAPQHNIIAADFSNIEGRGLAWLAGEEWKLQAFRDFDAGIGPDIYNKTAGEILNKPPSEVDKEFERQAYGKVPELALGFGGGVGAFQAMAKQYGVKMSDAQAEAIKTGWRAKHPKIKAYWDALDAAAIGAVLNPGRVFAAGAPGRECKYLVQGSFLTCRLPSGRVLFYPYPKILPVETPWGAMKDSLTFMRMVDPTTAKKAKVIPDPNEAGDWKRVSTYGGGLAENKTQALCRDFLALAMKRLRAAGFHLVLHVHDEPAAEMPAPVTFSVAHEVTAVQQLREYERICSFVPSFAAGMPIVAKGFIGPRYRKD